MRIPLEWLREFTDISDKSVEELSASLSLSGTEVEAIEYLWGDLEGARVGLVESVSEHPKSDRLLVVRVNLSDETLTIVTADTTVRAGERVAVLPEGASLKGEIIASRNFHGIESEGMFLSLEELGLADRSTGIMRLEEGAPGSGLKSLLGLDWPVIEVELTANRGDCLSMTGIAREVGAINAQKVSRPSVSDDIPVKTDPELKVVLKEGDCQRYTALVLDNVNVRPSPFWLRKRLVEAGLRPISNVVDITNYIMLESGHPIHAFDLDRIGSKQIIVRSAREGEKLELLDGRVVELEEGELLITNGATPLALAGIMGGKNSGIDSSTTRVLLEVAVFDPVRIRKTARRLAISTDSSYRFERGVDGADSIHVMRRLADLMRELACAEPTSSIVDEGKPQEERIIELRRNFVSSRLGKVLPDLEIEKLLTRLDFKLSKTESGWKVRVPAFRVYDITQEIDLVEEIGRIYGYDRLEDVLPRILPVSAGVPDTLKRQAKLKELMVANGFDEVVSYSFINPEEIQRVDEKLECLHLLNPLSMDMAVMRPSLIFNMLSAASYNYRRQNRDLKFFEIASIFSPQADRKESTALGLVATGRENPLDFSDKRDIDFFSAKGIVQEVLSLYGLVGEFEPLDKSWLEKGKSVSVKVRQREVGFFGMFNPSMADKLYEIKSGELYLGELNLTFIDCMREEFKKPESLSNFPRVFRDLSFLVPLSVPYSQLEELLRETLEGTTFREVWVCDIYRGKGVERGFESVTVTLLFESFQGTLTDEQVNGYIELVLGALKKIGVKLRG